MKKKNLIKIMFILIFNLICAGNLFAQKPDETSSRIEKLIKREEEKPLVVFERPNIVYNSQGARDPFKGLVQPEEASASSSFTTQERPLPAFTIQGVIWGGVLPQVIMNNKVLKVGDIIEEAQIVSIDKEGVIVLFDGRQYNISSPVASASMIKTKEDSNVQGN
ncbi:MAG: hypothetical protein PHO70_08155 [Candidatus Omnitrophica bacterium]|nr:hypothetical protein [Candidatus Omnitrophota bacterium]